MKHIYLVTRELSEGGKIDSFAFNKFSDAKEKLNQLHEDTVTDTAKHKRADTIWRKPRFIMIVKYPNESWDKKLTYSIRLIKLEVK